MKNDDSKIFTHLERRTLLVHLKRPQEGIEAIDTYLRYTPNPISDAYLVRAEALIQLSRFQAAVQDFDKAIEIDPKNAKAFGNKGAVLSQFGRLDEALEALDKSLQLE